MKTENTQSKRIYTKNFKDQVDECVSSIKLLNKAAELSVMNFDYGNRCGFEDAVSAVDHIDAAKRNLESQLGNFFHRDISKNTFSSERWVDIFSQVGNCFLDEALFRIAQRKSLKNLNILHSSWFWCGVRTFWSYQKVDTQWLGEAITQNNLSDKISFFETIFFDHACLALVDKTQNKKLHTKICNDLMGQNILIKWETLNPHLLLKSGVVRLEEREGMISFLTNLYSLSKWDPVGFWEAFNPFCEDLTKNLNLSEQKWPQVSPKGTTVLGRGDFYSDILFYLSEKKAVNFVSLKKGLSIALPQDITEVYQSVMTNAFKKYISQNKDPKTKRLM